MKDRYKGLRISILFSMSFFGAIYWRYLKQIEYSKTMSMYEVILTKEELLEVQRAVFVRQSLFKTKEEKEFFRKLIIKIDSCNEIKTKN